MGKKNSLNGVPSDWKWQTINDVVGEEGLFVDGDWIESKDQDPKGDVRLIQLSDIGDGVFKNKSSKFLTSKRATDINCTYLMENDILIARMPDPIGRACVFPLKGEKKYVTAVDVAIVRADKKLIDVKYLQYSINNPKFRNSIEQLQSGTTRKRISRKNLSTLNFPLPPLDTQKALVSKIEELFSELDKGVEQLKIAQRQLKIYRQAVLKWAFEGKFTNKNVKEGQLPEGWKLQPLGKYIQKIEAGKSFKCEERTPLQGEIGVLKVSALTWGEFDENESKTVLDNSKINEAYFVNKGDFLLSRANTIELVGNSVIVKTVSKNVMLSDKTLRIKFSELLENQYCLYFLRSRKGRQQIESLSTGNQESMRNIGQERIKQILIPFCLVKEQQNIVNEIESRLSTADEIEESIKQSLRQSESLRKSILKMAFDGRLLPSDTIETVSEAIKATSKETVATDI